MICTFKDYELREWHEFLYFEVWTLNFRIYTFNDYELRKWHELFSNKD